MGGRRVSGARGAHRGVNLAHVDGKFLGWGNVDEFRAH